MRQNLFCQNAKMMLLSEKTGEIGGKHIGEPRPFVLPGFVQKIKIGCNTRQSQPPQFT